jgi:isopenicillin N synthase-like dioxygenase
VGSDGSSWPDMQPAAQPWAARTCFTLQGPPLRAKGPPVSSYHASLRKQQGFVLGGVPREATLPGRTRSFQGGRRGKSCEEEASSFGEETSSCSDWQQRCRPQEAAQAHILPSRGQAWTNAFLPAQRHHTTHPAPNHLESQGGNIKSRLSYYRKPHSTLNTVACALIQALTTSLGGGA